MLALYVVAPSIAVPGLSLADLERAAGTAKPASFSQMGRRRPGLRQRNWVSRFRIRLSSIQARILGPALLASGRGSMTVRWRMPPGARMRLMSLKRVGMEGEARIEARGREETVVKKLAA